MIHLTPIDVTGKPDEVGITLLCTFATPVTSAAGRVDPDATGFTVTREGFKPRRFATAASAIRQLRKISRA